MLKFSFRLENEFLNYSMLRKYIGGLGCSRYKIKLIVKHQLFNIIEYHKLSIKYPLNQKKFVIYFIIQYSLHI